MSVKLCRSNTEARIGSGRDGGGVAQEDVEVSRAHVRQSYLQVHDRYRHIRFRGFAFRVGGRNLKPEPCGKDVFLHPRTHAIAVLRLGECCWEMGNFQLIACALVGESVKRAH